MSLKVFLGLIIIGTIIAWLSWGMAVFYFDPQQINFLGFSIFYLSLFLGLSGTIFLVSDRLRAIILKKQLIFTRLRTSVRQAVFFTILILCWAFLKSQALLQWWNLLLLILILTVLEFFFISSQKKNIYKHEGENSTTQGAVWPGSS